MSSPPLFSVSPVDLDQDWDELMLAFWNSWKAPLQASGELTFPHLGTNTPEEDAAFESTKRALFEEAKDHPDTVHWVKGVHNPTDAIVGAVCYKHEKEWPITRSNFTGCGFKPGTEHQALSDSFYRQLLEWRVRLMKGEHMYGQSLFVLPDYRSTAISRLMMEYCVKEVDSMGLEAFLEATVYSTPGLLRQGFIVVGWTNLIFTHPNPSMEWRRLVHDLQAHPISILWRPKGGVYIEGKTILPWTGKVREAKL